MRYCDSGKQTWHFARGEAIVLRQLGPSQPSQKFLMDNHKRSDNNLNNVRKTVFQEWGSKKLYIYLYIYFISSIYIMYLCIYLFHISCIYIKSIFKPGCNQPSQQQALRKKIFMLSSEKSSNVSSCEAGKSWAYLCHVIPWAGSSTLWFNLKQPCVHLSMPTAAKLYWAVMQVLLCRMGGKSLALPRANWSQRLTWLCRCRGSWRWWVESLTQALGLCVQSHSWNIEAVPNLFWDEEGLLLPEPGGLCSASLVWKLLTIHIR